MDDSIKDAIAFISNSITENPEKSKSEIIDEAAQKYDLNPMQEEFLINKFVVNQ